ncbi:MAG: hypothetical protein IJS07_05695 [Bacteroidales bacterium]|nr:hypothetical protein [Bacteroidales bacterium]
MRKFIAFPDRLYKDCPQYVPALHSDQRKSLTKASPLEYCEHRMWMVMDGRTVVGRICGMINPRYNERYGTKRARFGWFDTINDLEVARLLIDTATAWAKERGMDEIHGPLYYNTMGKQGMLVEGFENIPQFNTLYNYDYYPRLIEALGFEKECDWIQYRIDLSAPLPEKVERMARLVRERYGFQIGNLDRLKKDRRMVRKFFEVYNESFASSVYNFIPFTDAEIEEEAASSMPFISEKTSTVVLDSDGKLAAFGILFPSISRALQKAHGRLLPFGWIHLLRALHHYETIDLMVNGAVPKWQNTGVSAIYHSIMAEKAAANGSRWAISNPQIETNSAVNIWSSYQHELFMRRRCYVKKID